MISTLKLSLLMSCSDSLIPPPGSGKTVSIIEVTMGVSRTEEAETSNVLCTEYLVNRILSGLQFFLLECELFFAGNKKTMYTVPQYLFDN